MNETVDRLLDLYLHKVQGLEEGFTEFLNKSLPTAKLEIQCRYGCDACCYAPFTVTLPEALLLARELHRKELATSEFIARVGQVSQDQLQSTPSEWFHKKHPCLLLNEQEHVCSMYDARPAACRFHLSVSDPAMCKTGTAVLIDSSQDVKAAEMLSGLFLSEALGVPSMHAKHGLMPSMLHAALLSYEATETVDLARADERIKPLPFRWRGGMRTVRSASPKTIP